MDLFEKKGIKAMLIAEMQEPFDSPDYIYELKLDGERCIAYLDKNGTELQNKRSLIMNKRFPELTNIHKAAKVKCILDGELAVLTEGKPNFEEIRRRSLMTNSFRIELAASKYPACFTAFDILYYEDKQVTDLPLMERKKLLNKAIKENERIAISRFIEDQGIKFYELAKQQDLEGIVAKRKDSKYYMDKRTKDWIKIKNLKDDDFIVLGYIEKENNVVSIILGQYRDNTIAYKGHVTLGVSRDDYYIISRMPKIDTPITAPKGNEDARWILPELVCTVKYMEKTSAGGLRQPVYKGLRDDKDPEDCREKSAEN
jgi:bifunctional non-homologous end joining protein LigD